ncbi:hypothetical protein [Pseudomonas chlororaphis]|uniref:Uncharacterized protein n=1 Tax=Pseudomonas chlororaphis TaxID=587753 RepID=A0A1Q8EGE1_9PSED|nr:hypothetical protein [Pseudomonas chlororaphis]OLF50838.1 hypothetical protein BTN82_29475 [Pseudomonas chlororaphis]
MPRLEAVSSRADVWNVANTHCRVHYQLVSDAETDVLCRVLNHFALQSLLPQQVQVRQQDDSLLMDIVLDGLSWHRAQVIAEKLRNLISVSSVQLQRAEHEALQAVG